MGNVIAFPKGQGQQQSPKIPVDQVATEAECPAETGLIAEKEEDAFLDLLREWPCFSRLRSKITFRDLIDLYYDDELSLSQDCAIEFMLHMRDPNSLFDIGNAIYTWDENDRNFFMLSLTMHAELIDQVKDKELD